MLADSSEHAWPDFILIVKSKDIVGPAESL